MKKLFSIYQYLGPLICFPLAYYLWWHRLDHSHMLVLLVMSAPIVTSYVVPAVGTNYLKLWEFKTKFIVGKFRPHHGFVFGSAMSLLGYFCIQSCPGNFSAYEVIRTGIIAGSFTAFWNWLYDIYAIRAGFMYVYNRRYAEGAGAEAIAMDYAPMYFGFFGFIYGMEVVLIEHYLLLLHNDSLYWFFLVICNVLTVFIPSSVYMLVYYFRHGHAGVKSFKK